MPSGLNLTGASHPSDQNSALRSLSTPLRPVNKSSSFAEGSSHLDPRVKWQAAHRGKGRYATGMTIEGGEEAAPRRKRIFVFEGPSYLSDDLTFRRDEIKLMAGGLGCPVLLESWNSQLRNKRAQLSIRIPTNNVLSKA